MGNKISYLDKIFQKKGISLLLDLMIIILTSFLLIWEVNTYSIDFQQSWIFLTISFCLSILCGISFSSYILRKKLKISNWIQINGIIFIIIHILAWIISETTIDSILLVISMISYALMIGYFIQNKEISIISDNVDSNQLKNNLPYEIILCAIILGECIWSIIPISINLSILFWTTILILLAIFVLKFKINIKGHSEDNFTEEDKKISRDIMIKPLFLGFWEIIGIIVTFSAFFILYQSNYLHYVLNEFLDNDVAYYTFSKYQILSYIFYSIVVGQFISILLVPKLVNLKYWKMILVVVLFVSIGVLSIWIFYKQSVIILVIFSLTPLAIFIIIGLFTIPKYIFQF